MNDSSQYITVPSSEVRRRTAEYLDWYTNGGREKLRQELDASERAKRRERLQTATKGFFWWKRPLTPAEIEANVDRYMSGCGEMFQITGESLVEWTLSYRDDDSKEIARLSNAATSDFNMLVDVRLWGWIKSKSHEPEVALAPTS